MGSMLFGLLAMSIPVLVHLLHRQRTTPLQWGAMMFLLESPLQLKRKKRVEHWLLLLLRMALIGLLVFLLARPLFIDGKYNPLSSNVSTDIAVVVDRSVSTGRSNGQTTVFEQSLLVVDDIAKHMRPNDTLSIVLAEHLPNTTVTPLPVRQGGIPDLLKKLKELKPGLTDASIPDAVQAARETIQRGPNTQKLVLVVSDDQRAGWQIENNTAWRAALGERVKGDDKAIKMYAIPIAAAENKVSDVAVGELTVNPGLIGINRPAQVTATVSNSGPEDVAAFNAELMIDGKSIEKRAVASLKAGTTQTIRFDHTFTEAGSKWLKIRTDGTDALAADNEAISAAHVWQKLPVLVIDGQLTSAGTFRSSQFLVSAMQPVADASQDVTTLIQPKVVSVSDMDTQKFTGFPVVIVNDVPVLSPAVLNDLFDHARRGNGVWFIFGPRTEQVFAQQQLSKAQLFTAEFKNKNTAPKPPALTIKIPSNPMISLIAASEKNALTGAVTKQWWSLLPKDGDGQVVLTAENGDPLIMERPIGAAGGRVVVWSTSVDGSWNNLPLLPNFVPLVNETIYHLASGQTAGTVSRQLEAGGPLEWSGPATPIVTLARITRPDGKIVERKVSVSNGRQRLTYQDTSDPGLYAVRFEPTEIPQPIFYGFGINRKELDNAPLTESDFTWLTERNYLEKSLASTDVGTALGGINKGFNPWPYLGFGILGLLVFETFMTRRMINLQNATSNANLAFVSPPKPSMAV